MKRIICIGNRYLLEDSSGPAVFTALQGCQLPAGVELIDGGLGGLDLLRFIEGTEQVVFVDGLSGFADPASSGQASVHLLAPNQVTDPAVVGYDHSAGLAYLLRVLPYVCEGPLPEVSLVGIEGKPDQAAIHAAADLVLQIVGGCEYDRRL